MNMNEWRPTASIAYLKKRARILMRIRDFFRERDVLEVETPLMCETSVTDPFIESIQTFSPNSGEMHYLQTSPEYMMKRLLAAGSDSIFQICKAFRQDEQGRLHHPEFTMLEWYRIDFDHHQLMDEMDALLQVILNCQPANRFTYEKLFLHFLQINPHTATLGELKNCASQHHIVIQDDIHDVDTWLQVLLSHHIEPKLGLDAPCFVYDFPVTQAALARIQPGNPPTASRFEVYLKGVELANGFHELQDAAEQRARFEKNLMARQKLGRLMVPIDEKFLAALQHGLPDCAGVAMGLDRLVMLALGMESIKEVMVQ